MNAETGHNKNVTNFETLIIVCKGFGADYNPSNPNITIPALTIQHTEAKAAVQEVKVTETPFNSIEGQRKTIFKPLKPTATKVINALKATGLKRGLLINFGAATLVYERLAFDPDHSSHLRKSAKSADEIYL